MAKSLHRFRVLVSPIGRLRSGLHSLCNELLRLVREPHCSGEVVGQGRIVNHISQGFDRIQPLRYALIPSIRLARGALAITQLVDQVCKEAM